MDLELSRKVIVVESASCVVADSSVYSCSKVGLWMLTRVLAQELHKFNISENYYSLY